MVVVEVTSIRAAWSNAKKNFAYTDFGKNFWEVFGAANGMKVIITGYNGSFPVIDIVEFDDEQSYAWFMLKWA